MHGELSEGRVVIVDDHAVFAQLMQFALGHEGYTTSSPDLPASEGPEALVTEILEDPPDLLLLDLDLGDFGDGQSLIAPATRAGVDVVVVTGRDTDAERARAIDAGALAVLPKTCHLAELTDAVRRALSGEALMSDAEREELLRRWVCHRATHEQTWLLFDSLSSREGEVLDQLVAGYSIHRIARTRNLTDDEALGAVESILASLRVTSVASAIELARLIAWRGAFPDDASDAPSA